MPARPISRKRRCSKPCKRRLTLPALPPKTPLPGFRMKKTLPRKQRTVIWIYSTPGWSMASCSAASRPPRWRCAARRRHWACTSASLIARGPAFRPSKATFSAPIRAAFAVVMPARGTACRWHRLRRCRGKMARCSATFGTAPSATPPIWPALRRWAATPPSGRCRAWAAARLPPPNAGAV